MSLSKVIKSAVSGTGSIREFQFRILDDRMTADDTPFEESGFVPFSTTADMETTAPCDSAGDGDSSEVEAGDAAQTDTAPPQPGITEDELNERVREAFERGFGEGQRQAERGLSNVFKALRGATEEISGLRVKVFQESEEDLLRLSILVARKIIQQEISDDRRIFAKIVAAALENSSERDDVVVRLNPEDYRLVTSHRQLYLGGMANVENLNLKPDEAVSPGGCIVDTVVGEIDARLETQLDEIHRRLLEVRDEMPAPSRNFLEKYAYDES